MDENERESVEMNFLEKYFSGATTINAFGLRITLFGYNAMRFAVNISTETWGYLCISPTVYMFGRWTHWHIYFSPNSTPWAATFAIGPGLTKGEKLLAKIHAYKFGNKLQSVDTYINLRDTLEIQR